MIRKWLCSAFRVGQPQRDSAPSQPVSEVPDLPSHPAARPPILAAFRHPGEASVGPRLPSDRSFSGSKMPLSVSMLTVLHGETLYLRPPANQKRKLLYDLASFRCLPPAPSTLSSTTWTPSPTTTTHTSVSPSGAALDLLVAAGCPPKLMLLPAPGPWPRTPVLPMPTLHSRIQLNSRHLRIIDLPGHPGDASCQKSPQDALQNFDPSPQPAETEELTRSSLTIPHSDQNASNKPKQPSPRRQIPRGLRRCQPPPKRVIMRHRPLVRAVSTTMTARRSQK